MAVLVFRLKDTDKRCRFSEQWRSLIRLKAANRRQFHAQSFTIRPR